MIKKTKSSILFLLIISLIITLLFYPDKEGVFNDYYIFTYSIIIIVNVVFFLNTVYKVFKTWLRFDTLFILGYLIVHFQIPFLATLGIEPERADWVWVNKNVINYVVWLSTVTLLLWMFGFILYLKWRKTKRNSIAEYIIDLRKTDFLLLMFFVSFFVLVGKEFLSGSYSGTENWGSGAGYFFLIFRILLFLRIIYFFINTRNITISKRNVLGLLVKNKLFILILIFSSIIFLASGERGYIMQVGLIALGGYSIFQKKLSLKTFLLLGFSGAVFFTILKLGRTGDSSERDSNIVVEGFNNYQKNDVDFNPTGELATSMRVLNRAVDVVPDKHPYLYGSTLFYNLISVIPFAGSTYMEMTNTPLMYTSSTYFFTIISHGEFYHAGEGSEIIADLYINLGMYGVFIVMFFFGYFIAFISFNAFSFKQHHIIIIFLILLATSLYLNRAPFLTSIKDIVWALVFDRFLVRKIYT